MKRSGSGIHVFQLAFEHTEDILNTYFSYVWHLYRRTLRESYVCAVAYSGHFCFGGDLTKPSITIAIVDRFYLNLVIYLQLDIALLVQNSVKIWHCLSELWQCIQGVTFFVDTVYILFFMISAAFIFFMQFMTVELLRFAGDCPGGFCLAKSECPSVSVSERVIVRQVIMWAKGNSELVRHHWRPSMAWPFSVFTQKQVFGPLTAKSQPIWIKLCTHLLWANLDRDRRVGGSRPNQNDYVFVIKSNQIKFIC